MSFNKNKTQTNISIPDDSTDIISVYYYNNGWGTTGIGLSCNKFTKYIEFEHTGFDSLKNGDTITFTLDQSDINALVQYGVKITSNQYTITVKDLEEPLTIDLLEALPLSFSGYNGYGNVVIDKNPVYLDVVMPGQESENVILKHKVRYNGSEYIEISTSSFDCDVHLIYGAVENLCNSDEFTIALKEENVQELLKHGIKVEVLSKSFMVSGLLEPYSFNVFDYVQFALNDTGFLKVVETKETIEITSPEIGQTSLIISTKISSYDYINIKIAAKDKTLGFDITYSNRSNLKAGDVVTLTLDSSNAKKLSMYGIVLTTLTYDYTITEGENTNV